MVDKYRHICFESYQLDNPPKLGEKISYLVYQKEAWNRLHYKGYAQFSSALTMEEIREELGDVDLEVPSNDASCCASRCRDKHQRCEGMCAEYGCLINYPDDPIHLNEDQALNFVVSTTEKGWTLKDYVEWDIRFAYKNKDMIQEVISLRRLL